jgi:hypothetical protein
VRAPDLLQEVRASSYLSRALSTWQAGRRGQEHPAPAEGAWMTMAGLNTSDYQF